MVSGAKVCDLIKWQGINIIINLSYVLAKQDIYRKNNEAVEELLIGNEKYGLVYIRRSIFQGDCYHHYYLTQLLFHLQ